VTGEAPRFTDEQLAELTPAELAEYERLLEAEERGQGDSRSQPAVRAASCPLGRAATRITH